MVDERTARAGERRAIPKLLRELPRWCLWTLEPSPRTGSPTKRPVGSTLDPDMPRPFRDVEGQPIGATGGVGFVLTGGVKAPSGATVLALDVDACRDPETGVVEAWAREVWTHLGNSYAEVTPSGTGVRVWIAVRRPPAAMRRIRVSRPAPPGVEKVPEIQTFGCGPAGYVTVTGDWIPGTSGDVEEVQDLGWLRRRYEVAEDAADLALGADLPTGTGEPPDAIEILAQVHAHPDGEALVYGHWEELGVPSASEGWWRLVQMALRAARGHGEAAVDFLLGRTAYGTGMVDSRDPDRYARREWVEADVARVASKQGEVGGDAFLDGFDVAGWEPPGAPPEGAWLLQAADFAAACAAQRFLVYGVLPARGLAQLFGDPSSGKTPLALSLALRVALGGDWFGHPVERPGPVAYLVGEDPTGIRDRCAAQLAADDPSQELADLPVYFSTRPARLVERKNREAWARQVREVLPELPRLVVVDTQNRNFGPGNENATEDATAFVEELDALSRELGCLVLLVHHSGHFAKGRGRGSSVLPAALDAQFEVRRTGTAVVAVPTKSKNWRDPEPLCGRLAVVEVGADERGRPITAITLDDRAPDAAAVFRAEREERSMMRLLEALDQVAGRTIGQDDLADEIGISRKVLRRLVTEAREKGLIRFLRGSGRKGSTFYLTDAGRLYRERERATEELME